MPTKFPELFIDGITLKRETVTKFLGVFIDKNVLPRKPNCLFFVVNKSTQLDC